MRIMYIFLLVLPTIEPCESKKKFRAQYVMVKMPKHGIVWQTTEILKNQINFISTFANDAWIRYFGA